MFIHHELQVANRVIHELMNPISLAGLRRTFKTKKTNSLLILSGIVVCVCAKLSCKEIIFGLRLVVAAQTLLNTRHKLYFHKEI